MVKVIVTGEGGSEPMLTFTDWHLLIAIEKLLGSTVMLLLDTSTVVEESTVVPLRLLTRTTRLR